jgi:enamine deaminase RidA (YjgF/YER057c/UK114 family)
MIEHFERPEGLGPATGYSHAVAASGRLVAVSGQLPVDADGAIVDPDDSLVQARRVFANLGHALAAAGAQPKHVVKLTYFVIDIGDLHAIRSARDEFLGDGPPPASSLVQVSALTHPGARLEIDALAVTPARRSKK